MNDSMIRQKVHQAVDTYGAGLAENPFLAQQILAQANGKEQHIVKKKLSVAAIVLVILLLASVTAIGIGLTIDEIWQESFERMNTTGEVYMLNEPTENDMPFEEGLSIAREAIKAKFGATDEELDAMGVYPTFLAHGTDPDAPDEPAQWRIYISSRVNTTLDYDADDHGPDGEYRVYLNAETGEVTTCIWYTDDFWAKAQRIWDCGSHDEVHAEYLRTSFHYLPAEQQAYWRDQLAAAGYAVAAGNENLQQLLMSAGLELQFETLDKIADNSDPQVAAAWEALEKQRGLDAATLQKYAYVATKGSWNTGTDDVCIHYSYELEWDMLAKRSLDSYSGKLFTYVNHLGLYMVSFEPGTTNAVNIAHVTRSARVGNDRTLDEGDAEGPLLSRQDWIGKDLPVFDEAFCKLDRAVQRMRAAGTDDAEINIIVRDFLYKLGGKYVEPAPEGMDTESWFADESEWDALIVPLPDYDEIVAAYGQDDRFWPLEVLAAYYPDRYRMPHEGEMTVEQAIEHALSGVIAEYGQEALDALGDYTIGCRRVSLTDDPNVVDCRWEVYITDDPATAQNGWKVHFGEWEHDTGTAWPQLITDEGNG